MKNRLKICIPQTIRFSNRFQGFVHAILDNYHSYSLKYIDISRLPVAKTIMQKLLYKLWRIFEYLIQFCIILSSDVVFFCNMTIDNRLFNIAFFFKKQIVVDFYISRYQTSVYSRKLFPKDSKKAKKLLKAERKILKKSSLVIFLNKSEKAFYTKIIGIEPQRSIVIPLFVNQMLESAELRYWKCSSKLHFCWWGGEKNPIHGLSNILAALKILEQNGIDFDFSIFGVRKEIGDTYYYELLKGVGWEDRFVPQYHMNFQDHSLSDFLLQNCSIAFGPISIETKAKNVIANKSLEAISLGIPLVTIESLAMKEYFGEDMVWYCKDDSPVEILTVIQNIIQTPASVIQRKTADAKEVLFKNFTYQGQKRNIYAMFDSLYSS
jgi:glycosyltransferase involved in cell wall biosynthesis